jgi:hypothetical protein
LVFHLVHWSAELCGAVAGKRQRKKGPPFSRGPSRVARPFSLGLFQQQTLAALASLRGIGPKVNSLSGYFFLVFLAGFFLAILLFRIGLDLVAFLARFFFTGIGTSCSLAAAGKAPLLIDEGSSFIGWGQL